MNIIYTWTQFVALICTLVLDFCPLIHFSECYFLHLQAYIDKLVKEAYARWSNLEEIDEVLNDNIALLTQGIFHSRSFACLCQIIHN